MIRIALYIFLISSFCFAQEGDNYFIKKVNKVENEYEEILKNHEYIIYTTPHTMHLIIKRKDALYQLIFFGKYDDDFKIKDIKLINDKRVRKAFRKSSYEKGYVDGNSQFYKNNPIETISGLPTYFSYNTDFQVRYCEYFLSVGIKPVPMKFEVYQFLSSILLEIKGL